MTIETKMSLNADGNTAVTACLWQQLADCYMRVMLLRETNGLPELYISSGVSRICWEEGQSCKFDHGTLTANFRVGCSSCSMTNSFVTNAVLIERAVSWALWGGRDEWIGVGWRWDLVICFAQRFADLWNIHSVLIERCVFELEKLFPGNNLRYRRFHGGEHFEAAVRSGYRCVRHR